MSTTLTAPTAEDVRSELFASMMMRYVEGEPGLNEARDRTPSYVFRHSPEMRAVLGVWRWRGLYENRETILPLLDSACRILDHGGGACPLGWGAEIVESDAELEACEGPYDVVFSSHTLEHCADLNWTLVRLTNLLSKGGHFILHVPAYTATHWRAGTVRPNDAIHGPHLWNLCLLADFERCPEPRYSFAEELFSFADYVGDNSILVIGERYR